MLYSYFDSIKSKSCTPITVEQLIDRVKQDDIKSICTQILSSLEKGEEKDASRLKANLPVIVLGQLYEEGKPRSKNGGKPTGMLMIDYDDCPTREDAEALMLKIKEKWLSDLYLQDIIVAAHYSPRMHGIHIWYRWIDGCSSYEECNARLAQLLECPDYDQACKDNSRCSFLVPYDYFQILNMEAMQNNEAFAELQLNQEGAPRPPKGACMHAAIASNSNPTTPNQPDGRPLGGMGGSRGSGGPYPSDYSGVPYSQIISDLTFRIAPPTKLDADGNVLEGARDDTFFKMMVFLRYICDNNPNWLYSLAPDWALELDVENPGRVMEICRNACARNRSFTYPKTLRELLDSYKQSEEAEAEAESALQQAELQQQQCIDHMQTVEESKQKFLKFPAVLPPIFQEFCDAVKPEWKAAVVATLLPTLGTILSKARAQYLDGRFHSPSFQSVIEAPMGAGKSNLTDIAEIILEPLKAKDLEGNTQINIYNAATVKSNNSSKLGDVPDVCVRSMIGSFTEAGLNDTLNFSKGLHIWCGVNEIDQVASVWKQLSYILRLAFDNARYGRTIQSPRQFRGERPLFLNTFLCGTPNAVARVYDDPEDGLVSRTIFFKLLFETPDMPLTEVTKEQLTRVRTICKALHDKYTINDNDVIALETNITMQYLNNHMEKWLQRKLEDSIKYGNQAIDRFRRRDAVIGFRAGLVAHCIYLASKKKMTEKERKVVKQFAEWVADYALMMHDYKFGKRLDEALGREGFDGEEKKVPILDRLPDTFTLAEAYAAFPNRREGTVRVMLSRLVSSKQLVSIDKAVYSKN